MLLVGKINVLYLTVSFKLHSDFVAYVYNQQKSHKFLDNQRDAADMYVFPCT